MFDLFRKSVVFFLFVILFIFTKRICNINGIKHKCNNSFQFFGKQSAAKFTVKIRLYVLSFYYLHTICIIVVTLRRTFYFTVVIYVCHNFFKLKQTFISAGGPEELRVSVCI